VELVPMDLFFASKTPLTTEPVAELLDR
jgi:hypothetical protein